MVSRIFRTKSNFNSEIAQQVIGRETASLFHFGRDGAGRVRLEWPHKSPLSSRVDPRRADSSLVSHSWKSTPIVGIGLLPALWAFTRSLEAHHESLAFFGLALSL
jgi:hypothetical protein